MEKYLLAGGLLIAGAVLFPQYIDTKLDEIDANPQAQQGQMVQEQPAQKISIRKYNPLDGRKAVIAMDSRGHFLTTARMNGANAEVLVDTGATVVAMNQSTARRMGVNLKESDFKYPVRTANGITKAAKIMLDYVEIGRVRVENVEASVSKDDALNVVLLGMAFLQRLEKFEISNGELVLSQ